MLVVFIHALTRLPNASRLPGSLTQKPVRERTRSRGRGKNKRAFEKLL